MTRRLDAAIFGAGPAGVASAIVCRRLGLHVALFDRESKLGPRVGETFGPDVRTLLSALGLHEVYDAAPYVPFRGVRSAWGSGESQDRPSMLHPLGDGRHVDRAAFDSLLRESAREAGVGLFLGPCHVDSADDGWRVEGNGYALEASRLVDAAGRGGGGKIPGRQWIALDRLAGVVGWFEKRPKGEEEPELLLESVESGWWYSAPQPDESLVVALMTDSDLIEGHGRKGLRASWLEALGAAPLTSERVGKRKLKRALEVRRAESGFSHPVRGPGWIAIGDAAFACDPLAGTGVAKALESGMRAAAEIASSAPSLTSPVEWLEDYLSKRARYYGVERRWPGSIFWARRKPADLDQVPVMLDPRQRLVWNGTPPSAEALAPIEALIPPRAVKGLLASLKGPKAAHEAMSRLREQAGPLGDRRLFAGLQALVALGVLGEDPNGPQAGLNRDTRVAAE